MNRNILFLTVILILFAFVSQAQNQPVAYNPNMLANSQGLPENILLFSSDTSVQILFNPARAACSDRRFVYTNYLPYSNPTLSAAALFNTEGSTWLLQVSNTINKYTRNNTTDSQSSQNNITYSYIDNSTATNSNESCGSFTTLKLSLIGGTSGNSYSLGAYGIIYPSEENSNSYNTSFSQRMDNYSNTYQEVTIGTGQSHGTSSRYAAGIEYTLAGSDWDLITGVQIAKNKIQTLNTNVSTDTYQSLDSYGSNYYKRISTDDLSSSISSTEPIIYRIYGYFHQTADLITSTDHYFISSSIYSSSGKIFISNITKNTYWYQYAGDLPYDEATTREFVHQEETNDWGVSLSTGYLVTRKLIDIEILIGLNPQFSYNEFKEAGSETQITENRAWAAAIQIPIYLNYTPIEWCSFFGGLNYRYTYSYQKYNISTPTQQYSQSGTNYSSTQSQEQTRSSLNSTNNVYAGMELRHASGLYMQFAFNQNLSSFSGWNISLGFVY
jgi:hypothetical protein